MIAVEELDRGQIGEMAIDRLLDKDLAAAGLLLGIGLDAAKVGIGKGGLHFGQRARHGGGAALVLGADEVAAARQRLARRLGKSVQARAGGDDRAIERYGFGDRPSLSSSSAFLSSAGTK
jgi:hypothetical protein